MPTYQYKTKDGLVVERMFSIRNYPQEITLDDGAVARLQITGGAGPMKLNWEVQGATSDLPAESA